MHLTEDISVRSSVEAVCQGHGITRQAYYKRDKAWHANNTRNEAAMEIIRFERARQPRMGTRKLYKKHEAALNRLGFGRDRLFDFLRDRDMLVRPKRRWRTTTDSNHALRRYDNLLADYQLSRPNEVFASDITYLRTVSGFCYLSLVTDVFSRKIVGWDVSSRLSADGSIRALKRALGQAGGTQGLIHHSDQGIQYCCGQYVKVLEKRKVKISMASKGNPYENAIAERVNGILKDEYYLDITFATVKEARQATRSAIMLYNDHRPHLSLNYLTPSQKHVEPWRTAL